MKPGRELDALVAEKVMGLPVKWWDHGPELKYRDGVPVPKYSTDIAAAWEAVERFGGDRFILSREPGYWECDIADAEDVQGITAPHAICLAALKALG